VEVVASLSQGHTAAAQCGLFTYKSVPFIFEPPCIMQAYNNNGYTAPPIANRVTRCSLTVGFTLRSPREKLKIKVKLSNYRPRQYLRVQMLEAPRFQDNRQGGIPPCIPDSHPHRVTNTKCRVDTVISPDDGHIVARKV